MYCCTGEQCCTTFLGPCQLLYNATEHKDFNGHDEDGGDPCHTHLVAKGRVRGFVVGLFGEVSSDTLTLVRHCVDMIAYRVWKRSGFSSASECCAVLLPYWGKN